MPTQPEASLMMNVSEEALLVAADKFLKIFERLSHIQIEDDARKLTREEFSEKINAIFKDNEIYTSAVDVDTFMSQVRYWKYFVATTSNRFVAAIPNESSLTNNSCGTRILDNDIPFIHPEPEVVAYQKRNWFDPVTSSLPGWQPWEICTKQQYQDVKDCMAANMIIHVEVRKLQVIPNSLSKAVAQSGDMVRMYDDASYGQPKPHMGRKRS